MFRIKIMHYREMVLLQKNEITQDLKTDCEKKAKALEREITHLPLLTSTLHRYVLIVQNEFTFLKYLALYRQGEVKLIGM